MQHLMLSMKTAFIVSTRRTSSLDGIPKAKIELLCWATTPQKEKISLPIETAGALLRFAFHWNSPKLSLDFSNVFDNATIPGSGELFRDTYGCVICQRGKGYLVPLV